MFSPRCNANCVENILQGKRFLLILDDVWIERSERKNWTMLSKSLGVGAKGSVVVITTRSVETSIMMAKVPELQLELGAFSEEKSRLFFRTLAFPQNIVLQDACFFRREVLPIVVCFPKVIC